jgi:hypothetical protein
MFFFQNAASPVRVEIALAETPSHLASHGLFSVSKRSKTAREIPTSRSIAWFALFSSEEMCLKYAE